MGHALSKLAVAFLYLLSLLPLRALFIISDFFFLLLYYVIKYRKKVVISNLERSFPNKTASEINAIAKGFYKHFCDVFIETIKFSNASEAFMKRHITFKNKEVLEKVLAEGKDLCLLAAHYGNWEIFIFYSYYVKGHALTVYHELSNKPFDNFYLKMRTRFGVELQSMENLFRAVLKHRKNKKLHTLGIIADQHPAGTINRDWLTFLNQDSLAFLGPEKIAKKYNYSVYYTSVTKEKRGHYSATFKPICQNAKETDTLEITKKYYKYIEDDIYNKPEYYLWSHRRWKAKKQQKP